MKKYELRKKFKKLLLKIIDYFYQHKREKRGRKNKFDYEFYLDCILKVLFYGNS